MMMRIIDAHLVQEIADREIGGETASLIQYVLSHTPTIEAEPVRHGEWRIFRDGCVLLAECSECGTVQSGIAAAQWDYCPMCGCRMDGGADDGA